MKECSTCKKEKSKSEFSNNKSQPDGLCNECKNCKSIRSKKYRLSHPDKEKERKLAWASKNTDKVRKYFREYAQKYRSVHPKKVKDSNAKRYKNNPEYYKSRAKKYYKQNVDQCKLRSSNYAKKHPEWNRQNSRNRRATIRGSLGKILKGEWEELCNSFGNKCLCCGKNDVLLTLDHIVPLKLGGSNTIDNAQPLCLSCNSKKHTKVIDFR